MQLHIDPPGAHAGKNLQFVHTLAIKTGPTASLCYFQIQWVGWMDGMPDYVLDPNARFSDIIVPTTDTVRAHFMLELLVTNWKPVRFTYGCDYNYINMVTCSTT